jgi:6,7-dimethyl-8-ribityllumazine synthase
MSGDPVRILVVEARFYADIADELLKGATDVLEAHGAEYEVVSVPGAFEIPAAIAMAEKYRSYDGYVALGCVIRGETTHYDYVAGESARALMDLSVQERLPIGYGVLTVEDEEQAWARARISEADKGGAVARACLDMIALKNQLKGRR